MANYDFKKDLEVAKTTEDEVIIILSRYIHNFQLIKQNDNIHYDFAAKIDEKLFLFEVKEDFYCKKSGNIALEFECRGKASGISVSKAHFYIYKIHEKNGEIYLYLFNANKLKELIKQRKYTRIVTGGDKGSKTKNYLFTSSVFKSAGRLYHIYL